MSHQLVQAIRMIQVQVDLRAKVHSHLIRSHLILNHRVHNLQVHSLQVLVITVMVRILKKYHRLHIK